MELQIVGLALVSFLVLVGGLAGTVLAVRALRRRLEGRRTTSSTAGEV
ncbi:hypothetical protein [Amycolatopsis coloradensis]|nr:hypothetical protein [Amycolatopsis coloradensis]